MSGWRDFVEEMKDAAEALTSGLSDDRRLTPMLVWITKHGQRCCVGIENAHFEDDERLESLIRVFVVPLMIEQGCERAAWLLNADVRYVRTGDRIDVPECIVLAAFDREVEETWAVPVHRYEDAAAIGTWLPWPANETSSRLVQPVQEAIR